MSELYGPGFRKADENIKTFGREIIEVGEDGPLVETSVIFTPSAARYRITITIESPTAKHNHKTYWPGVYALSIDFVKQIGRGLSG